MDENLNNLEPTPIETSEGQAMTGELPSQEPTIEYITLGEEITDDDRNRVYDRLGRPQDPDKYDLSGIVPETFNQSLVDEFRKKAHENGMSNEGARKMAEWYRDVELRQVETMQKARQEQSDMNILQLKTEFGVKFEEEVNNARKALDAYTDKDFRKYMDESGLGNHPALVKAFAKIGRELSEDRLVQSETATKMAQDDQLRRSEILRLRADKQFMDKYRRGDPSAVQRLNRLYDNN